jgi:hypothetical protein
MRKTADRLREEYNSDVVENWVYDDSQDTIKQKPVGLLAAPDMRWVNRPTFQQVVQVGVNHPGE